MLRNYQIFLFLFNVAKSYSGIHILRGTANCFGGICNCYFILNVFQKHIFFFFANSCSQILFEMLNLCAATQFYRENKISFVGHLKKCCWLIGI